MPQWWWILVKEVLHFLVSVWCGGLSLWSWSTLLDTSPAPISIRPLLSPSPPVEDFHGYRYFLLQMRTDNLGCVVKLGVSMILLLHWVMGWLQFLHWQLRGLIGASTEFRMMENWSHLKGCFITFSMSPRLH